MPPPKGPVVAFPADLFDRDPRFRALAQYGRDARGLRDLYVQMWFHCRRARSDGFVPAEDIPLLVHPEPGRTGAREVERLVRAGVVERAVGGYHVPAYLDANPSREREDALAAVKGHGAQKANHDRWHVRRNDPDPGCPLCLPDDRGTHQSTDQYSDQSTDQYSGQYSDQSTDRSSDDGLFGAEAVLPKKTPPIVPPTGGSETSDDPAFAEFWQVYPRKIGKPRSRKAWRLAVRKGHDPALITAAAKRYAAQCEHEHRESRFIAHPSTWLNDERYLDAEETPAGSGDDDDFWSR